MRNISRILYIILWVCAVFATACDKLDAEKEANKGKKALLQCEFTSAEKHFAKAHSLYASHKDILFGYAISELVAYTDTDAMHNLFADLGIRSLRDVCLERIQTDEEGEPGDGKTAACNPIELSEWRNGDDGDADTSESDGVANYDDIRPDLTWGDILRTLSAQQAQLEKAASLWYEASQAIGLDSPWRTDAFGYTDVPLHQADLATVSAALWFAAATIRTLERYDFEFSVRDTLRAFDEDDDAWIERTYNEHLLRPAQGVVSESPKPALQNAFTALRTAMDAIAFVMELSKDAAAFQQYTEDGCPLRRSLFHWEKLRYGIFRDFDKLSHVLDANPNALDLAEFFDPHVTIDLDYLYSNMPMHDGDDDVVSIQNHKKIWHLQSELRRFNEACTPAMMDEDSTGLDFRHGVSWRLNSAWRKFHWYDVL